MSGAREQSQHGLIASATFLLQVGASVRELVRKWRGGRSRATPAHFSNAASSDVGLLHAFEIQCVQITSTFNLNGTGPILKGFGDALHSFQAEISMPAACPLTQVGHHSKQRPQDAQSTDHFASRPQAGTKHSSPRPVELVATVAVILLDHRCLQASNHAISTLDLEVQPSCIIVPVSRVYNSL